MPVPPGKVSELTATLVAVGVGVNCSGRALGDAVGGDDPPEVAVGEGGCPTMDVGLGSGVLAGTVVPVGKVIGVDVGGVGDAVAVGTSVGVDVGSVVGVQVGVAVGNPVGVSVGVEEGGGPGVADSGPYHWS